jgi:hypothetical protein
MSAGRSVSRKALKVLALRGATARATARAAVIPAVRTVVGSLLAALALVALSSLGTTLAPLGQGLAPRLSSVALAQGNAPGNAQGSALGAAAPDRARQIRTLEAAIERRARSELNSQVDDFLSRRLERSDFTLGYEVTIDRKALGTWVESWSDAEFGVILAEVQKRSYDSLRPFLSQVTIDLAFAERLSQAETTPIVESLEAFYAAQGGQIESVESRTIPLPPALPERIARLQVQEAARQVEREAQLRLQEMQEAKKLELANAKEIQETKTRELAADLEAAKRKLVELRDQLLDGENLKDRIIKEAPILTRLAAAGAGVGALVFAALFVLGVLLVLAFRSLGGFFVAGTEALSQALREQGGSKTPDPKQLEPFEEPPKSEEPLEDLEEDALVEFDTKPQLKEAAEQLKAQVLRDMATTAAVLSKVVEQEKYGEVVAIFDILGPELAQRVYALFTSSAKRLMQRAFFQGQIKRVGAGKLFNRVNEIRTMLATTDVLMRESTDKAFAQVALSFSDEEIAQAVSALDKDQATAMLTVLPPDRMFRILRQCDKVRRAEMLTILGATVESGATLSAEAVSTLASKLLDEKKLRVQENVRYLKNVVKIAEDDELDAFVKGLEYNARMLLDVIGVRATVDDLWAQPAEIIEGLFSMLELEPGAALLFQAPEAVRASVLEAYPERKRALTEDALDNLRSDDAHRERAITASKASRKMLLGRLSEMAEAGTVTLPSRERLLRMAEEQEREAEGMAAAATVVAAAATGGAQSGAPRAS